MLTDREHRLGIIREDVNTAIAARQAERRRRAEERAVEERARAAQSMAQAFAAREERLRASERETRRAGAEREARVTEWALQPPGARHWQHRRS